MLIRQFRIEGLGHLSTLVGDESNGVAAVVDPRRDVDIYLAAAREADLRISHVVETHLHNDYVSGGRDLAALTGARHVIGMGADLAYEHGPVRNEETFDVGSLRFTALDTPGHTPEHAADVEAFVKRLLRGQPAVPRYFARMRPTNQAGPAPLAGRVPEPRPLSFAETRSVVAGGALLLDLRPAADHSVSHAPGSLSIPLGPSF